MQKTCTSANTACLEDMMRPIKNDGNERKKSVAKSWFKDHRPSKLTVFQSLPKLLRLGHAVPILDICPRYREVDDMRVTQSRCSRASSTFRHTCQTKVTDRKL
jgi:hypothetical protein